MAHPCHGDRSHMHYEFITTVTDQLWQAYASRTIPTWQHQPVTYWQGQIQEPAWEAWRSAARQREGRTFEQTCVRFSHKVQAQIWHSRLTQADYMIWLDADVAQLRTISQEELAAVMPGPADLCTFLDRQPVKYAETGWIAYNMRHPRIKEFFRRLEDVYLTQEIWSLAQWHDAFVWDHVRQRGRYPARNLLHNARSSEPFDHSDLGGVWRHYKGQRKARI